MKTTRIVAALVVLFLVGARLAAQPEPKLLGVNTDPKEPWALEVPKPEIPPAPKGWDLTDPKALKESKPLVVRGDDELDKLKADGTIVGSGTEADPYVIENRHFKTFYHDPDSRTAGQLVFRNTRKHVLVRNCWFEGEKIGARFTNTYALSIGDSRNITLRHCRSTLNRGLNAWGSRNINFEYVRCFSTGYGIYTSRSGSCRAWRCHVNDTTEIGIFLYNGPDNTIEECYVHDTGREGIGTHGNAPNHTYRNNVIFNTGWNGINMEGRCDGHLMEGNLVVNTHYGILIMGGKGVSRKNRIFNCTQNGFLVYRGSGGVIEDNLIVGSMQDGVWIYTGSSNVTVKDNTFIHNANGIKVEAKNSEGGHRITGNTFSHFMKGVLLTAQGGHGVVVKDNTFRGGRNAVYADEVNDAVVADNRFVHTLHGVRAMNGRGWSVNDNTFKFVGTPVQFIKAEACTARGNTSTMSYYSSFNANNSKTIVFRDNTITGSRTSGIILRNCSESTVAGNSLTACGGHSAWQGTGGIYLKRVTDTTVTGNTLKDILAPAVRFREFCSGVVLKDNVYVDNEVNVQIPEASRGDNTLDTDEKLGIITDKQRRGQGLPPVDQKKDK